ncbi:MAG TPA: prepilin-type N-terminal cleavage/methylation domain-containing protein [Armatimonadota bacterium]|jgi:prepilin-type N-terminal cleavage/methylation domain-containing protein/prepilin-type processing-associated H-X9-DG protein
MQRKRAFTLIELLVVIAIIAILAAILFPVFAKARESARKTKSLNNIKQLATAVTMYSQDYQETFPGWTQISATAYAHNCWDEQINAQVKAKDAFNNGDTGIKSLADPVRSRVLTYGINALLITPPLATFTGNADFSAANNNPPAPSSPGAIGSPAQTILFAELATNTAMTGTYAPLTPAPIVGTPPSGTGSTQWQGALSSPIDISPRAFVETGTNVTSYNEPWAAGVADKGVARDLYGGGGVYAFCDGHAQFMKIGKSVGLGTSVGGTVITNTNCWAAGNTNNMWNPQ